MKVLRCLFARVSCALGSIALLAGITAPPAFAYRTAIDFRSDISQTGEAFPTGNFTTSGATGAIPFVLNFGSLTADTFCMSTNGFVGFSSGACSISATPSSNFIAPFFANLTSLGLQNVGNSSWSVGQVDPLRVYGTGTNTPIDALRFIWQMGDASGNVFAEPSLLILNRGGGDFDFDLRYGSADAIAAQQGFTLGSDPGNMLSLRSGPFSPDTNYYFCVRGGAVGSCGTTTTVPEPTTLVLLGIGLVGVFGFRRTRRLIG